MKNTFEPYSKGFEQGVRGLCSKYYEMLNDSAWEYVDLLQEAEIMIWEQETLNPRFIRMSNSKKESYLYIAIKYCFIDILNKVNRREKAEEGLSEEN